MTELDSAIRAAVSRRFEEEVGFLAALVRHPSDNPPGDCADHAAMTAALLEALGFVVERHPVPEAAVRACGMLSATNLIIRHRFGAGPVVALNAHGDVVAPGEGWSSDPYGAEIRDGRMYGRGAAVSKSDFATYAFALLALKETAAPLAGSVELHLTYDEETGGLIGPGLILAEGLSKPDYALSAGFAYNVTIAHNGCLHLDVTVRGKSAHAARPETGHDALEAATQILAALYAFRGGLADRVSAVPGIGHANLNVGLISGGINTNVVPDKVSFRIDRRMIPEERPEAVEQELCDLIANAAASLPGITVDVTQILVVRPMESLPGQDRLVAALTDAAEIVLGEIIGAEGTPIYCDARLYTERGIPTVLYGAGPRTMLEANGHRADENLAMADLKAATETVAIALTRLLQA
ncbi:M20/M25/M40 family metallo-hydrolase [Acidisoma cellulosilytica]|uniref:M20/M25/M40 family metallo-hydrolase n=1 Tax=Acidisoma cellulosilyticum TaxID=2802395 RepID=A0A963Z0R9_9PROT|nr:M20/M25/M40 family metallo-hydrolase [Acidisoma cellulosilyticum]MCB8880708.1 M20/M25/M40 family metallo-hydrolase [Acidisoma cellulosilyticum]